MMVCMAGGTRAWQGGMHGGRGHVAGEDAWQGWHAWQGVCMAGGHAWQGACMAGGHAWQGGMCGRGVCGWNAFLLNIHSKKKKMTNLKYQLSKQSYTMWEIGVTAKIADMCALNVAEHNLKCAQERA